MNHLEAPSVTNIRNRAGRKRKSGRRKPSGDLILADQDPTDADPTAIARNQPHRRGLSAAEALDSRLSSVLGRLEFIGALTGGEIYAARRYSTVVRDWRKVIEAAEPGAQPVFGNGGIIPPEVAAEATEAFRGVQQVLSGVGPTVATLVYNTAVNDEPLPAKGFIVLRRGLAALTEYFRLTDARKSVGVGNTN